MRKLTEEEKGSIYYFITEKGDVERMSGWEEIKPIVNDQYPELIAALEGVTVAERTLKAVTESTVGGGLW